MVAIVVLVATVLVLVVIDSKFGIDYKYFVQQVEVIFEEFYQQGDAEREAGRIPIPMMDRTQVHLQPDSQVQFISEVCIPCYKLLYHLIPETKPLLDGVQTNLSRWRQLKEENERCVTPESPDSIILPPGRPDLNRSILTRTVSLPVTIDLDVA